jgi:ornithine--oxo-acid transaminase
MATTTANGSRADELIALETRHGARNYQPLDVVIERGEGVYLWDVEGRRYLDFLSAYSAVNQGHSHPRIAGALARQACRLALTSRAFRNDRLPLLLEKLCRLTGFERALLMNSGAEAVETAIKASRKWGYDVKGIPYPEAEIVVFAGNFHGRTTTIVGFSTDPDSVSRFGPFTPGFRVVPYGDLDAVRSALTPRTCAVLAEPVQGEAGVIVPPRGFLRGLRELCDAHGVLLVLDEIQSGLGRTGTTFACEHEDVVPDMYVLGKALGGGIVPISAVVSSADVLGVFRPGQHGSTFGGNPLACAVAREVIAMLSTGEFQERSAKLGAHLHDRLSGLPRDSVREVRGRGLWAGVEFATLSGREACERLAALGVLAKDTHGSSIRLAPPLIISESDLDWAIDTIAEIVR